MIKTQYNTIVRAIRSDNGGEYISDAFCSQLNQKGILHQLTSPQTPEHNGVAERKNRHIMSIVRCLLCGMHVPKSYWHMVVFTAVYLINRTPSRVLHGKLLFNSLSLIVLCFKFCLVCLDVLVLSKTVVPLVINWITNLSSVSS